MQHVDEGTLQAWLDGEAVDPTVEAHVRACRECAGLVEELRALSTRASGLLAGGAPERALPDFEAVRVRGEHTRRRAPRRRWQAPAWAASVVIALGVGWMAREIADRGGVARAPEVLQAPLVAPETVFDEVLDAAGAEAGDEFQVDEPREDAVPADDRASAGSGARQAAPPEPAPREPAPPAPEASELARPTPARTGLSAERRSDVPTAAEEERDASTGAPAATELPVLRGRVVDAESGDAVASAELTVPGTTIGTFSGPDGTFELPLEGADLPDSVVLQVGRIGFQSERLALGLDEAAAAPLDIRMKEMASVLSGLSVTVGRAADDGRAPQAIAQPATIEPVARLDPSSLVWSEVPRAEAERQLDAAILAPEGAAPSSVDLGTGAASPVVRYLLPAGPGGELIIVYQGSEAPTLSPGGLPVGHEAATRRIGDVWVLAAGPVTTEVLEALLDRMR